MSVLVTGAAGFIGFHVCRRLLERGEEVIGVDQINDYYDPALKHARLDLLRGFDGFRFHRLDIADREAMFALLDAHPGLSSIISLAAQAGVRYSLVNPFAYSRSNVEGHLVVLEMCRRIKEFRHLVYASSSSVYGANTKLPFAMEDRVDHPVSLYAATKKAGELMAHAYSHLYRIPMTGLRFFTVYGPWGRPDMAYFSFAKDIVEGRPIRVFNNGDMRRDFTYIDDIVDGVIGCLDHPPRDDGGTPPQRVYNIGNNQAEPLMRFIGVLESALGRKAELRFEPMQPGDVKETYADISAIHRDIGFQPSIPIDVGIPRFVDWFRSFYKL
ncbi:MAG: NAD-dependent epimerase/dehydratase family protein [Alphaproteobacteria bacterium]|nr:NAD-dependent epimerase/dehydratase family protein [Alphaproteobacteria bacterium]